VHGWSPQRIKKQLYIRFVEAPLLNRSNGVFALTESETTGLRELGVTAKIHLVPNGINIPDDLSGSQRSAEHGHLRALYVGRINPKKRIEEAIRAIALSHRAGLTVRLAIAGDTQQFPEYSQMLKREADKLGVSGQIEWLGYQNESLKRIHFASADLFLHMSESEGMAMAILEAMAYSLPVIASQGCYMSAAAGASALLEYGSGPEALASALGSFSRLSSAERANLGHRARRYVEDKHSWAAIARRTLGIYAHG
jgi:poly(glycerol-phosphate) alpha-glucosyltransferase